MPLLTEYYKNTCLQDITVNISISTPPMHIGPAQVLCTSHCRYQIGGTCLDDTKSNKLSVTINPSIAVTIRFSLTYFPNLLSKNMCFTEESRYYLCRKLVQQFDCPIDRAVFTDICVLFPGPNSTTVIIPAQVAWSF